jgi:hypothetical protein
VRVPERHAEVRGDAQIAQAGVLELERDARHAHLQIRRHAELRRLILDVVLEVDMRISAHGVDFLRLLKSSEMQELLL